MTPNKPVAVKHALGYKLPRFPNFDLKSTKWQQLFLKFSCVKQYREIYTLPQATTLLLAHGVRLSGTESYTVHNAGS